MRDNQTPDREHSLTCQSSKDEGRSSPGAPQCRSLVHISAVPVAGRFPTPRCPILELRVHPRNRKQFPHFLCIGRICGRPMGTEIETPKRAFRGQKRRSWGSARPMVLRCQMAQNDATTSHKTPSSASVRNCTEIVRLPDSGGGKRPAIETAEMWTRSRISMPERFGLLSLA